MSDFKDNPALYREMNIPHESVAATNEAVEDFLKAVGDARKKYRIASAYITVAINYLSADGDELQGMTSAGWGDGLRFESMCAYALGTEQAARRELVNRLVSGQKVKK